MTVNLMIKKLLTKIKYFIVHLDSIDIFIYKHGDTFGRANYKVLNRFVIKKNFHAFIVSGGHIKFDTITPMGVLVNVNYNLD